jgi:DNA-binding LacI/PurR family transcriptional regulator
MVVWGAPLPDALYPVVGGDNAMGGYLATQHLIAQGSRRIAFFGDYSHPEAGLRYQGYQRALQEAGIEQDPRLLQPFLFGDARIREVIDRWLDLQLPFDAIFASSDVTAISLMGALTGAFATPDQRFAATITLAVTGAGVAFAGIGAAFWGLLAGLSIYGLDRLARRNVS